MDSRNLFFKYGKIVDNRWAN